MRQGQQNRRGRGRNRKSQNPLTRSFESTGPDVKLRGTPSHIAEKYMSLARDALSSGDPVLAENYMQHAEHYNRIIMSFREQQISQGGDPYAGGQIARGPGMPGDPLDEDDFGEGEGEDFAEGRQGGQADIGAMPQPAQMPQQRNYDSPPRYDNRPQHHRRDNQQRHNNNRHDRGENRYDRGDRGERNFDRQDRGDRNERFDRNDRGDRGERNFERQERQDRPERSFDRPPQHDRGNGGEPRPMRDDRMRDERMRDDRAAQPAVPMTAPVPVPVPDTGNATEPVPLQPAMPRRRERFQPNAEAQPGATAQHQPEFLRRPVRRPRPEPAAEDAPAAAPRVADEE